eukprot:1612179-Prymnesium_polylepis.2
MSSARLRRWGAPATARALTGAGERASGRGRRQAASLGDGDGSPSLVFPQQSGALLPPSLLDRRARRAAHAPRAPLRAAGVCDSHAGVLIQDGTAELLLCRGRLEAFGHHSGELGAVNQQLGPGCRHGAPAQRDESR